jgi:hypothetical protein
VRIYSTTCQLITEIILPTRHSSFPSYTIHEDGSVNERGWMGRGPERHGEPHDGCSER